MVFFGFFFGLAYYFTTTPVCEKEKRAEKPIRQFSRNLHQGGLLGPSRNSIIRRGGFCSLSLSLKMFVFPFFLDAEFWEQGLLLAFEGAF